MLKSSKWITGVAPEQPVTVAARRALDERLRRVWYFAKLAARKPEKDIEYVHQLRVSTRRARAALRVFGDALPRRRTRLLTKTLRGLRRAAGDARDLDVLGERLTNAADRMTSGARQQVLTQVAARRRKAQKPLRRSFQKAKRQDFAGLSRALQKRIRWRGAGEEPVFADAARARLQPPLDDFFAASAADLSHPTALHAMRIAGKRLRYAMELLAGAFDESFRTELYPIFSEVQDKLGVINDHVAAIATFQQWLARARKKSKQAELAKALARLITDEKEQLDEAGKSFLKWWTPQRATDLKKHFDLLLDRSASSRNEVRGPSRAFSAKNRAAKNRPGKHSVSHT